MVDSFISSSEPATILPINDRLYIREYLNYMRNIIKSKPHIKAESNEIQDFSTAVS